MSSLASLVEIVLIASCAELLKTEFKIIPRFDRCRKESVTVIIIINMTVRM